MKIIRSLNLVSKIAGLVVAASIIPVVIGLFVTFNDQISKQLNSFYEHSSRNGVLIESALKSNKEGLKAFSGTPPVAGIMRAYDYREVDPFDGSTLMQWQRRYGKVGSVFLENYQGLDKLDFVYQGKVLAQVSRKNGVVTNALPNEIKAGLANENDPNLLKKAFGELAKDEILFEPYYVWNDEPSLQMAIPVTDYTKILTERVGVMVVTCSLQQLLRYAENKANAMWERLGNSNRSFLNAWDGENGEWTAFLDNEFPDQVWQLLDSGKGGQIKVGNNYYFVSSPIYPNNANKSQYLFYVSKVSGAGVFLSAFQESMALTILLTVIVLVTAGLGIHLTKHAVKPVALAVPVLNENDKKLSLVVEQIQKSSVRLADDASSQAAALEQTSASLTQMTSQTNENAQGAELTKTLAKQANDYAKRGLEAITTLNASVDEVRASNDAMNIAMDEIKSSSDSISKVMQAINEIAFQTNILALNAAVEAARAGDAGLGFAVVADEVRGLALRSADAARETSQLIEDSILKSSEGVEACRKVNDNLEGISSRASEVNKNLDDISHKVQEVDEAVEQIAAASVEQKAGIEQITKAVGEIDMLTQNSAEAAERGAAQSNELIEQAAVLKETVNDLKIIVGTNEAAHKAKETIEKSKKVEFQSEPRLLEESRDPITTSNRGLASSSFALDDSFN
ncbi:MAG: methyl-accepting chemotaxis protein [Verrucomicrobiota bacterium]